MSEHHDDTRCEILSRCSRRFPAARADGFPPRTPMMPAQPNFPAASPSASPQPSSGGLAAVAAPRPLLRVLAEWAAGLEYADIPRPVIDYATSQVISAI